jgi:hypothetical protein
VTERAHGITLAWAPSVATVPGPGRSSYVRPALPSTARPHPKPMPRSGEPCRPRGAQAHPLSRPPPPPPRAVAHAPKGMPPMLQHIRQGSLHLKVFCTPTRAPAIQGHPCRSSRASLLRRPPLAPPRANTAPDRSGCLPSPRASPLAHV